MTRREILVFVPVYSSPTILFIPLFGVGGVFVFNVSRQFANFLVLLVQLNSQFKYFTAPAHFLLQSFVMIQLQPNFCLMMKKSKN